MKDNPLILSLMEICVLMDSAGIEYMLVGGLAAGIWAEPRATVDIDLLVGIKKEDIDRMVKILEENKGFILVHKYPMQFKRITILRAIFKGYNTEIMVDFLLADDEFKREAIKRKEPVFISSFKINIVTPEDLILLKLLSNREQDIIDVKKILDNQKENLDFTYIKRWTGHLEIELPNK